MRRDDEQFYLEKLGEQLRLMRIAAGLTQEQLAALLDTGQGAISETENGVTGPRVITVRRIAHVLGFNFKIVMEKTYEA